MKSSREERRAAHPELAAWVDDIRKHFPESRITYTQVLGYVYGVKSEGFPAVIVEKQ